MKHIYALLTAKGTACTETVLYSDEYTEENRKQIEMQFCSSLVHDDPPIADTWTDVTLNTAFWPDPDDDLEYYNELCAYHDLMCGTNYSQK